MPTANARNKEWQLPADLGEKVNYTNAAMVAVALLLDIREELRTANLKGLQAVPAFVDTVAEVERVASELSRALPIERGKPPAKKK